MKSVELNLIPIFVAIIEEKNLSRAAERLNISQPAVSKALKRLREVYHDPIVNRVASGVEPTPFALDIYPALSAALANFNSTLSSSRNFEPSTSDRVFTIASISVINHTLITELVEHIRKIAPKVSLEVHSLFTQDIESDLRQQRYDLIIGKSIDNIALRSQLLFPIELMIVRNKQHPRIIGNSITKEEFWQEEHAVVSAWESRKSLLDSSDILELNKRNAMFRAPGTLEILPAVGKTDLIGISTRPMVEKFSDLFNVVGMTSPFEDSFVDLYMIWHPSRTKESAHSWLREQINMLATKHRKSM